MTEHLALVNQPLPCEGYSRLLQECAALVRTHGQWRHPPPMFTQKTRRREDCLWSLPWLGIFVVSDLCKTRRCGNAAGTWVSLALTSSIDAQGWTSMPNVLLVRVFTLSRIACCWRTCESEALTDRKLTKLSVLKSLGAGLKLAISARKFLRSKQSRGWGGAKVGLPADLPL
jgi:hypothetical protein